MKKILMLEVSLVLFLPFVNGCRLLGALGGGGFGGGGTPGGGGQPPIDLSGGGAGFNPGGPLAPGNTGFGGGIAGTLPQPGAANTPPFGQPAPFNPGAGAGGDVVQQLRQRGISVAGRPTQQALQNLYIAASQMRVENTRNVTMYFLGYSDRDGVLAQWTSNGMIEVFNMNTYTATFHELVHHGTLYQTSQQGAMVGRQVVQWIQSRAGGGPRSWPSVVVPGSYARTDVDEYMAEFFSVMRVMDLRLPWDRLAENGQSGIFNPPAELRQIANQFYDPGRV